MCPESFSTGHLTEILDYLLAKSCVNRKGLIQRHLSLDGHPYESIFAP